MVKFYGDYQGDGGSQVAQQVETSQHRLSQRMSKVHKKIAIMSGKGGVGKSTMTANLAAALSAQGHRVGVIDADMNGPCMAQMLGAETPHRQSPRTKFEPVPGAAGVSVMSMAFFLERQAPVVWDGPQSDAHVWRGTLEINCLRDFIADTDWGDLDFLLFDLPPGSDRFAGLHALIPELDGVIIVTLPSDVSRMIVGKSVTLARDLLKARVWGTIVNMSHYFDVETGRLLPLFGHGAPESSFDLLELAEVPFDPRMVTACDQGRPLVIEYPDSPSSQAIEKAALEIQRLCGRTP